MDPFRLSTERLRHLLGEIEERGLEVCLKPARDIPGPGGGVYIAAQTPLTAKHLDWLDSRNPSRGAATYLEVVYAPREEGQASAPVEPPPGLVTQADESEREGEGREERARAVSGQVTATAREVAEQAERMVRLVARAEVTPGERRQAEADASLREFGRTFSRFHGAVKKALDEYLGGNTLVMDLILKYELDRATVRHGLAVAAFATEMATLLALRDGGGDGGLDSYFGDIDEAEVLELLGEPQAELDPAESKARRLRLFRRELVEIFLGGFMHDCGMWTDALYLQEGHEVKGTRLIAETPEVQGHAPALSRIVLFHSEIARLARKRGAVEVVEYPDDRERLHYRAEFFDTVEDARAAMEMRAGSFRASVLTDADLRKVLPVALAEHYISQTQDVYRKPPEEVLGELATHIRGGTFLKYMVVLCNSRVEVIAPRRALVSLEGHLSVVIEGRRSSRRAARLQVDGFDAGSLHHGSDRNSPHLISLFLRRRDGSREKAEYVSPYEAALWDRSAGAESRMYIPAGRYRNNLSFRVTGFMSEELYGRILADYESEFRRRLGP
ncbi:MAG: hypothetical protein ABIL09_01655 [Gemmatimonadota bacterium]